MLSPFSATLPRAEGEAASRLFASDDYDDRWRSNLLLRLRYLDRLDTSGCGWIPAHLASLVTNETLSADASGFPLLVGTDIQEGIVQIECPFHLWADPMATGAQQWPEALDPHTAALLPAGSHKVASPEVIWLHCPSSDPPARTESGQSERGARPV